MKSGDSEPDSTASAASPLDRLKSIENQHPTSGVYPELPSEPTQAPKAPPSLEQVVGGRLFLWMGAAALILAGVFLVNFGIEKGIMTPHLRMIAAAVLGGGLYLLSWRIDKDNKTSVADLLCAVGVAILFATVLGSRFYYHYLGIESSFLLLVCINALLFVRSWQKNRSFGFIVIYFGYVIPLLVQYPIRISPILLAYFALFTITICAFGAIQKRIEHIDRAGLLQSAWSIALAALSQYSALTTSEILIGAAAVWIAYEILLSKAQRRQYPRFELLTASVALGLWVYGIQSRLNPEFWTAEAIFLAIIALASRWRPCQTSLLIAQYAAFIAGFLAGHQSQSLYNIYIAIGLLATALITLQSDEKDSNTESRYSAAFPVIAASILICHARFAHIGHLRAALTSSSSLLALEAVCIGIGIIQTILASRVGNKARCDTTSSALCCAVGFGVFLLFSQYWALVGLCACAVISAFFQERRRDKTTAHFEQVFCTTLAILIIGVYNGETELGGSIRKQLPLLLAPVVWMGVPALILTLVHLRFKRFEYYAPLQDRAAASLLALALSGVLWEGHVLIRALTPAHSSAYEACHTGGLVTLGLGFVWLVTRIFSRGNKRSLLNQVMFAFGIVGVCAAIWIGVSFCDSNMGVGKTPAFNALWLIYGFPWIFVALISRQMEAVTSKKLGIVLRVASLAGWMALIVFLVRQAFHGSHFMNAGITTKELYWISTAMGLYGIALLTAGVKRSSATLRLSALSLLCATALKLFLWDMGSLSGLYRVLAFLGLGAALMIIGYTYQKSSKNDNQIER
jgi:uncharacterized membrane protein